MVNVKKIKKALKLLGQSGFDSRSIIQFSHYLRYMRDEYTDRKLRDTSTSIDRYLLSLHSSMNYLDFIFENPPYIFFKEKSFWIEVCRLNIKLTKCNKWFLINMKGFISAYFMIPISMDLISDENGIKIFYIQKVCYPRPRHIRYRNKIHKPFFLATNGDLWSISRKSPEIANKKLERIIIEECTKKLKH